jgi:hypothetical protein
MHGAEGPYVSESGGVTWRRLHWPVWATQVRQPRYARERRNQAVYKPGKVRKVTSFLIICPSRSRPHNVRALLDSWEVTNADAELLVVVDDDDPSLSGYLALQSRVRIEVNDFARRLGPILNAFAVPAAAKYDVIGFLGDDNRPRTPGWDHALARALGDRPGIAYGNDLIQGEKLPTAAAVSAPIISELGYISPPGIKHFYIDNFWRRLGQDIDCLRYLPDVVIEHLHPGAGTAPWDERYQQNNEVSEADRAAFQHFLRSQWPADRARLRKRFDVPEPGTLMRLRERLELVEPENVKRLRRRLELAEPQNVKRFRRRLGLRKITRY